MIRDGSYEALNPKNVGKGLQLIRLLSCSNLGISFKTKDGHVWIDADGDGTYETDPINTQLENKGFAPINSKIYGGLAQALDRVDGAMKVLGKPALIDQYVSCWQLEP